MFDIKKLLTQDLIVKAIWFETLRIECKKYLWKHNMEFDKFTVVSHDSFIWYLTEKFLQEYITNKNELLEVEVWDSNFDFIKLKNIVDNNLWEREDIEYVKKYFYDKWDLKVSYKGKSTYLDIKTALTQKEPNSRWNFLYPVIQANREWKDYMLLTYYVVDSIKDINSLNKITVIWYISESIIKKCKIIKAWDRTVFWTTSQIDNYITELSVHYKEVDDLIKKILN